MSIGLATLEFLASEQGNLLLEQLIHENLSEENILTIITRLRHDFTMEQASALLGMARLRQKAEAKFGSDARHMFFTDSALQQASDPQIRDYRAENSDGLSVLDMCCGIGADSMAFASAGAAVHGVDSDALRIAIATYNAQALGLKTSFEVADVRTYVALDHDLIFYDPSRRDQNGKRIFDLERYQPALSLIQQWQKRPIMVKLAPGVALDQVAAYDGLLEFVSVAGDLKEAILHLNRGKRGLRATLISDGGIHHWQRDGSEPQIRLAEPGGFLLEPDPSILRATLVRDLAASLDAWMLDETIAYLCVHQVPESVWVRAWRIQDWMPFNLKRLRAYLRERKIGKITVKKRGSAIVPEDLIAKLRLKGDQAATIVLTLYRGQHIVMICDPKP